MKEVEILKKINKLEVPSHLLDDILIRIQEYEDSTISVSKASGIIGLVLVILSLNIFLLNKSLNNSKDLANHQSEIYSLNISNQLYNE